MEISTCKLKAWWQVLSQLLLQKKWTKHITYTRVTLVLLYSEIFLSFSLSTSLSPSLSHQIYVESRIAFSRTSRRRTTLSRLTLHKMTVNKTIIKPWHLFCWVLLRFVIVLSIIFLSVSLLSVFLFIVIPLSVILLSFCRMPWRHFLLLQDYKSAWTVCIFFMCFIFENVFA